MADAKKVDLTLFAQMPETIKSEHYRTIYINTSRMGISPWDIRMTLGNVLEREPGKPVSEDQATVVMTPGLAKNILHSLAATIKTYEDSFGEIPNPIAKIEKAQADAAATAIAAAKPAPSVLAKKQAKPKKH